jgi:hypothetical protein
MSRLSGKHRRHAGMAEGDKVRALFARGRWPRNRTYPAPIYVHCLSYGIPGFAFMLLTEVMGMQGGAFGANG